MEFRAGGQSVEDEKRWYADGCENTHRFNFPLTKDSVVFEVGGYTGWWTEELRRFHGFLPQVYLFEPMKEFYDQAVLNLSPYGCVKFFNYGLSDKTETVEFGGDIYGSGKFSTGNRIEVYLRDVAEVVTVDLNIDLMAINIEGGEYPLLERLLDSGTINRVDHLMIQFHNLFEGAIERRNRIREGLTKTHEEIWCYPFVWESWKRR